MTPTLGEAEGPRCVQWRQEFATFSRKKGSQRVSVTPIVRQPFPRRPIEMLSTPAIDFTAFTYLLTFTYTEGPCKWAV